MTRWEGAGLGLLAAPGVVAAVGGVFGLALAVANNSGWSSNGIPAWPRLALEVGAGFLILFGLPSMVVGAAIGAVVVRGIRGMSIAQVMVLIAAVAVSLALTMAIVAAIAKC